MSYEGSFFFDNLGIDSDNLGIDSDFFLFVIDTFNMKDEKGFLAFFEYVKDLSKQIDYEIRYVLIEILKELAYYINNFSSEIDSQIATFLNELTSLDLPPASWKYVPFSFLGGDGNYEYALAGEVGGCEICNDQSSERSVSIICSACDGWVCCGYIEFKSKDNPKDFMCFTCVESKGLDEVVRADLKPYVDEKDKKKLSDFQSWMGSKRIFSLENDLIESLLGDNIEILDKKPIGFRRASYYLSSYMPIFRFNRDLEEKRIKLFAWLRKNRANRAINIQGKISDGTNFQRIAGETVLNLDLKNLDLTEVGLSHLTACSELKNIDISDNSLKEIDLRPLSACTNLMVIDLSNNSFKEIDLSPLSACTNLQILNLHRNELTTLDLTPLKECKNLQIVNLGHNDITRIDISSLKSLEKFNNLELKDNEITTFNFENLGSSLRVLGLNGNKIQEVDLEPLFQHGNIEKIGLGGNTINYINLSPLRKCSDLISVNTEGILNIEYPQIYPCISEISRLGNWQYKLLCRENIEIDELAIEDYYGEQPCIPEWADDASSLGKDGIGREEIEFWSNSGYIPFFQHEFQFIKTGKYRIVKVFPDALRKVVLVKDGCWEQ